MRLLRSYLEVLRLPGYLWFWTGIVISALGAETGHLALVWFVKEVTASPVTVGIILSLRQIHLAIGSLLVGPILDRGARRRLMILDNALRGVAIGALALLATAGLLRSWHLYVLVAGMGLLSSVSRVGSAAVVPALTHGRTDLLPAANALNQTEWQLAALLGPALGGLLLLHFSPPRVLLLDAAALFIFAAALSRLPVAVDQVTRTTENYWRSLVGGARWLLGSRPLTGLTLLTFLFNLAYGPFMVALPFYVESPLGAGPAGLGWLWTAFAGGSLVGGLAAGHLGRLPARPVLAGVMLLWGLFTLPLAWTRTLPVALGLMFLAGAAFAPFPIIALTARQRLVPAQAYGRVFGLTLVMTQLGTPIGSWLGGWLVTAYGAPGTIGMAGLGCLILGLAGWLSPGLKGLDPETQATP